MIVKSKVLTTVGVTFDCKATTPGGGKVTIRGKMKQEVTDMPNILKDACVPLDKWWLIYSDIMPILIKCVQSNEVYNLDMKSY